MGLWLVTSVKGEAVKSIVLINAQTWFLGREMAQTIYKVSWDQLDLKPFEGSLEVPHFVVEKNPNGGVFIYNQGGRDVTEEELLGIVSSEDAGAAGGRS